jgi:hypothetical protein
MVRGALLLQAIGAAGACVERRPINATGAVYSRP